MLGWGDPSRELAKVPPDDSRQHPALNLVHSALGQGLQDILTSPLRSNVRRDMHVHNGTCLESIILKPVVGDYMRARDISDMHCSR